MDQTKPHSPSTVFPTGNTVLAEPASTALAKSSRCFFALLGLLMLLGVVLRVAYIDQNYSNPDERVALAVVKSLSFPDQWDTNWIKSEIDAGWHYDQYNFSSYHYLLYFWKSLISLFGIDWADHLGPLRALNGVLGVVFIGAIACATRQTDGEIAGLAAAAAAAILPLLVHDAHYLRCEAMLTAGMAILLWLSLHNAPGQRGRLLSAGLLAGWMIACKASMGLALPLLLLLLFTSAKGSQGNREKHWLPVSLLGLGCVLGFAIGVPWGVAQPQKFLFGLAELAKEYNTPMPPYTRPDMEPSIHAALAYLQGTLGWGFIAVTALGFGRMIRITGWGKAGFMLLPLAAALIVFGGHALFTERSYSPFLPIAVVWFGVGTQFLLDAVIRQTAILHNYRAVLAVFFLTVTLAVPSVCSWKIVFQVFSGREQVEKDAALVRMKGNLKGKVVRMFNVSFHPENYREIASTIKNHEPVLVVLVDYYDAITPTCLATLQTGFHGRILGVRESIFPDLPSCQLNTFMSPRLWLLYIPPA